MNNNNNLKANTFGELVKYIRTKRNLTIEQLAEISNISQRQIFRIEKSEVAEGNIHTINTLSNALNVNLLEYATIFSKFESLDDYYVFCELRHNVETKQYATLSKLLENYTLNEVHKREFSVFTQMLYYSWSVLLIASEKNYKKALDLCFSAIKTNIKNFNPTDIQQYITSELSYSILAQITTCLFSLSTLENDHTYNLETAKKLSISLIKLIEHTYFDAHLPNTTTSSTISKTYITSLNNLANILFTEKDYTNSINYCTKALDNLTYTNSYYERYILFFLISENYYCLNNIHKSQEFLNKTFASSVANNNTNDFINSIVKPKLANSYTLLTMPTFYT